VAHSQVWLLRPVISVTWEVEIGRIMVWGQPRQKVHKIPSQPIKNWFGGMCLSSQIHGKHKYVDLSPGWPQEHNMILIQKKN
jgi:hypothetical protein